jgi:PBP1b-binding outer membrane lipoprotein LpoB
MKLIKILTIIGLASMVVFACSDKSQTTGQTEQSTEQQAAEVAQQATPEAQPAPTETAEIDGMVTQTEKGLALVSDAGTYIISGEDLSDMIGKKVKVTGAIAETDGTQIIRVTSVSPME